MTLVNGNLSLVLKIGGLLVAIITGAVGYGTLRKEVADNHDELLNLKTVVQIISTDPNASAAGAALGGDIKTLGAKLDDIKQQLNRIENKVDQKR